MYTGHREQGFLVGPRDLYSATEPRGVPSSVIEPIPDPAFRTVNRSESGRCRTLIQAPPRPFPRFSVPPPTRALFQALVRPRGAPSGKPC